MNDKNFPIYTSIYAFFCSPFLYNILIFIYYFIYASRTTACMGDRFFFFTEIQLRMNVLC